MELQGYFTSGGLELAAKLSAGARLEITRVLAGAGQTAVSAAALAKIKQELAAGAPRQSGATAVIPVTLAAAQAQSDYSLTELGVYARDPDKGETLYKIYRLAEPVRVSPASRLTLRFYLEETVSQDVNAVVSCSPAGLITETDFAPLWSRVEQTELPSRRVQLDAAELQPFLDSLPRFLAEGLVLSVAGTLDSPVVLEHFSGPGYISLMGGNGFTMRSTLKVSYCAVPVIIYDTRFEEPADGPDRMVDVARGSGGFVELYRCDFSGLGPESGCIAIGSHYNVVTTVVDCRVSGFKGVVTAGYGSGVTICSGEAGDYHDNQYGAGVWRGGIVSVCDHVPSMLGANAHTHNGGLIIDKSGNLI